MTAAITTPALAEHAEAIRLQTKAAVDGVIKVGYHLTECKKLISHGYWLPWLKREFGWTVKSAERFMLIYKMSRSANTTRVSNLNLPLRTLYLLAAPSTPKAVRKEIVEKATSGEVIQFNEAKEQIAMAKKKRGRPPGSKTKKTKVDKPAVQIDKPTTKSATASETLRRTTPTARARHRVSAGAVEARTH